MILYGLIDVFLVGAMITLPIALVVIAWSVYKGDFD